MIGAVLARAVRSLDRRLRQEWAPFSRLHPDARLSSTLLQAMAESRGAKRGHHRKKRSESDIPSLTGQINGEKKAQLNY